MILRDYADTASFWRTGKKVRHITIRDINDAPLCFRNGWNGYAFAWNPFSVNALQVNGKVFLRGWGIFFAKSIECEIKLTKNAKFFSAITAINDDRKLLNPEKWLVDFEVLDCNGNQLASTVVKKGETARIEAELPDTDTFHIRMTDRSGAAVPVCWLEPEIVYSDGTAEYPGERGNSPADIGLSFDYDGVPFIPELWTHTVTETAKECYHHRWISPDGKLEFSVDVRIFEDLHIVEWTPYFTALTDQKTAVIENFLPLHLKKTFYDLPHNGTPDCYRELAPLLQPEVILRRTYGSKSTGSDFTESEVILACRHDLNKFRMTTEDGRSSSTWLPFFELDFYNNRRINFAVGWSGEWVGDFEMCKVDTLEVKLGMKATCFHLRPGEKIRQPAIAAHFSVAEFEDSRNEFRKYITRHRQVRDSKKALVYPPICAMYGGTIPSKELMDFADLFEKYALPIEVFWIDAGWYGEDRELPRELLRSDWYSTVGNWRVNQLLHPEGFMPLAKKLHEAKRKFLLWVEIERAVKNTPIVKEHPEYFVFTDGDNCMLDLGNDAACDYAIDTISKLIDENGLDWYREDFNFNTIPFWEAADEPDRIGMAESRFITGFYRFWGTLRKRYPDLMIDNCASGGQRIDMETLSLSIPLWRSDFQCFRDIPYLAEANQVHFDGLSRWIPFHSCGTVVKPGDDYAFISGSLGTMLLNFCDELENFAPFAEWLREMLNITLRMRKYLAGNYYRLFDHTPKDFTYAYAMELFEESEQAGYAAIFRREMCKESEYTLKLRDIIPDAQYEVEIFPAKIKKVLQGTELQKFQCFLPEPRSYQLIFFKKL